MWTWTFGASIITVSFSAAGSEQTDELRDHLRPGGVVAEGSLSTALHELRAPKRFEMVGQGRARDFELRLDVAHGHFTLVPHQEEEDLETAAMGECLERFGVPVGGLQPGQRECFHGSTSIEISNFCQAVMGRPPFTTFRSPSRSAGRSH